ncbi:MAG TPA: FGGY-family carbohydrate kinase, partial [Acidimicrobiales bacterium]|nr:FGGY-family carbohydrate kinase [Acidimicrobiales bacterium]
DRRTAEACRRLEERGLRPLVRRRTGLVPDPYFSATKMQWLLEEGGVATDPRLALGTVDAWVLWNLTGGRDGVLATDATNAARTMLFDVRERRWSEELAEVFGVPLGALPEVRPSAGDFGAVAAGAVEGGMLAGVPVAAMAGDQHAALFGQACFERGMAKVTFGTGTFVLLHAGPSCPDPVEGLVTTLAWDLGRFGPPGGAVAYALEGSVFASGAGIQWLRDGLGIISAAAELEPLARSVGSSDGVVVVPAFTGLGSPLWDPTARGAVTGITRGTGRAHLARAMVEAMALQATDVLDAMAAAGVAPTEIRVDGGAAVMDLLLQQLADHARLAVLRPATVETTAVGAATMAGLAVGLWPSLEELGRLWRVEASFRPS